MRNVLIILLFSFNCGAQTLNFQLLDADNSNTVVPNNSTFLHVVAANFSSVHNFSVNNNSASTQTVIVKRYIQYLNTVNLSDMATAPFSYNQQNFPPMTYSAVASALSGQNVQFNADLYEASIAGPSEVHYKFMDASDTTKAIKIIMKYNVATGLSSFGNDNSIRVFPNPVNSNEILRLSSSSEIKRVELCSADGKKIGAWENANEISIKNIAPGMYIAKIETQRGTALKKLIILH